jgi:hypothetical protein
MAIKDRAENKNPNAAAFNLRAVRAERKFAAAKGMCFL